MHMKDAWKTAVVTAIGAAVYVAPNTGKTVHKNRPHHGFVLNDAECGTRDYCFEDGTVLHTEGNCLFYLPRGSSYHVKMSGGGGCYAINFDADISDAPFCAPPRSREKLLSLFRAAAGAWKNKNGTEWAAAMTAVYGAIHQLCKEKEAEYVPSDRLARLAPALSLLERDFTDPALSVSALADLCGMTEVYFRRLFRDLTGASPKEYLIEKRLAYAKNLLLAGDFSVSEVALLAGYGDVCHFSREFSCRTGISPSKFAEE
jgi:AraC-like DNA-binding protein